MLHVSPEAAAGGPLALVADGDEIELDVTGRRLELHVAPEDLERRRAQWQPPVSPHLRGYPRLYMNFADEIMLITTGGVLIRTRISEIRDMGRATQGVRLINLGEGEKLAGLEKILERDDDESVDVQE